MEVAQCFNVLFGELGFNVISHPNIVISSTHVRAAIQTRAMTAHELQALENLMSTAFQHMDGTRATNDGTEGISDNFELQKHSKKFLTFKRGDTRLRR
jgi:hypothetical protein